MLNLLVHLAINSTGKLTRAAFLQICNFEKCENVVQKNGKYVQSLFLYNIFTKVQVQPNNFILAT